MKISKEEIEKRKADWQSRLSLLVAAQLPFQFWKEPRVLEASGLKRSTMRQMIADGFFPPPVKLSERSSAWPSVLVEEWQRQILLSKNSYLGVNPAGRKRG